MKTIKKLKNSRGQALVEAALTIPIIVFFLGTIIWFAKVALTYQQILGAARYGTDLIANTPFSKQYIEQDIRNYLCNENNLGRILNSENLKIKIEIKDFQNIEASFAPTKLLNTADLIAKIPDLLLVRDKSYVEISYSYKYPAVLKIIGKENMTLNVRSEVLSGNGSAGAIRRG